MIPASEATGSMPAGPERGEGLEGCRTSWEICHLQEKLSVACREPTPLPGHRDCVFLTEFPGKGQRAGEGRRTAWSPGRRPRAASNHEWHAAWGEADGAQDTVPGEGRPSGKDAMVGHAHAGAAPTCLFLHTAVSSRGMMSIRLKNKK